MSGRLGVIEEREEEAGRELRSGRRWKERRGSREGAT